MNASNTDGLDVQLNYTSGTVLGIGFESSQYEGIICNCCGASDCDNISESFSDNETDSSSTTNKTPAVELPGYRAQTLARNHVYILDRTDILPLPQASLVARICGERRASSEVTISGFTADTKLRKLRGLVDEADVTSIFLEKFGNIEPNESINKKYSQRVRIYRTLVPNVVSTEPLSQPAPDLIYGYSLDALQQYVERIHSLHVSHITATENQLTLPFFSIEFKGQTPSSGSGLYVAENQAVGSSSACVKLMEHLSDYLRIHWIYLTG